jgi:glycosyltransferase involved in cell wall biosynthesis
VPDLVISNSQRGAADARARGFAPPILVIPNGIDTQRFRPRPDERQAVRASLGVPGPSPLVGAVGKLDEMKDFQTFVRAAALLRRRREVRFVWVGPATSASRAALAALERELGPEPLVRWHPPRADVEAVHAALDVATLCSAYGEGFPNVVGEAMACGTPCVVTDVGDAAHVVGDTGTVVPVGAASRLADAWDAMLSLGTAGLEAAGRAARARIVERFSVDVMVRRTLEQLSAVARRKLYPAVAQGSAQG